LTRFATDFSDSSGGFEAIASPTTAVGVWRTTDIRWSRQPWLSDRDARPLTQLYGRTYRHIVWMAGPSEDRRSGPNSGPVL